MISSRAFLFSFLSIACVGTFLYYTLLPQGPHLLRWKQPSTEELEPLIPEPDTQDEEASEPKTELRPEVEEGGAANPASTVSEVSKADKFTPEVLLSAPRRSAADPNADGTLAVYKTTTYSFESHEKTTGISVVDLKTGHSRLVVSEEGISSPVWLEGDELLWLKSDANSTKLVVGDVNDVGSSYEAATVAAPVSDIRVKLLSPGRLAVALVALARPDGTLYSPSADRPPRSSARLYDSVMVRNWDTYVTPTRNAIWHGFLQKGTSDITKRQASYSLGDLTNVLKGSKLESPIPTFGGLDNFDLGSRGVCFVAKDPGLNSAFHTKSNFYFVAIEDSASGAFYSSPTKFEAPGVEGASTSPVFSPDGESAAFLQMKEDGYESDKNHMLLLDVDNTEEVVELLESYKGTGLWHLSPSAVDFAADGHAVYLTAEDEGRVKLFRLAVAENPRHQTLLPDALTQTGSISQAKILGTGTSKLLLSGTSLVDNSFYAVLDLEGSAPHLGVVSSNTDNGSSFGLSPDQVSEIWFQGAGDYDVHAWVVKPSNFEPDKKYPLAYLIHGGPQGSWEDSWSTRWNPAVFSEQGYVVVTPNPTGSTGYGQEFTDGIRHNWGGRPYQDLVNGFEYIKANMSFVDTSRAVAAGASYGGYMMAWMQGHPLAKEFKALVCHDGSFNLPAQLSSDEQFFPNHDLGGPPTEDPHAWDEWSPQAHISNWTTPMLIIHNELDYRLPISEGLAMFNVLQEREIESRFLSFPDENHWVLKEENSLVWHAIVLNWMNSFVGLPEYMSEEELGIVVQN